MKTFARSCSIALLAIGIVSCSTCEQTVESKQQSMVERQIRFRGIADDRILRVMRDVPRQAFVPAEFRKLAYEDVEVPIGEGQTLDRPYDDALILQTLGLAPKDKILEVGTGSGYLSALMSRLAAQVYTIEIVPSIGEQAGKNLTAVGYENIEVKIGDGYLGWEEHAPFDAIVLTASPSEIPQPLKDQLAEGGRLLLPLGGEKKFQELLLYEKKDGKLTLVRRVAPATFVPMKGIVEDK